MAKSVQSTDSARDTKDATESSSIGSYRSPGGHYVTVGEDPAMEKKVWRKIDTYVLPIVAMFYLLSFLVSSIQHLLLSIYQ